MGAYGDHDYDNDNDNEEDGEPQSVSVSTPSVRQSAAVPGAGSFVVIPVRGAAVAVYDYDQGSVCCSSSLRAGHSGFGCPLFLPLFLRRPSHTSAPDADSDHGRLTCRAGQQAFLSVLDSIEVTFAVAADAVRASDFRGTGALARRGIVTLVPHDTLLQSPLPGFRRLGRQGANPGCRNTRSAFVAVVAEVYSQHGEVIQHHG